MVVDGSDDVGAAENDPCADDDREAAGAPPEDFQKSTRNDDQHPENHQKITRRPLAQTVREPESHQEWGATTRKQPGPPPLPDRIVALLRQDPSASRREIAAALDTTPSTVRYQLDKLRQAGKIERIGPDKGGRWKVLGDSTTEPDPSPAHDSRSPR
ncbi:MAG: winged helix-turn-helix transcriptional regulator [bacterium]|nr:winged helix-turn-helix transcriptional regulator [bacterium]